MLCEDESVIGTPFFIMEYVEGRIFWNPALPDLHTVDKQEIFKQMEFAIEGGKHVQVENAMSKYFMTKEQQGSLEGLIFKKKKK